MTHSVSGLRAGREFALVVRAAGDEGVSPPVVLTAFTLTDNAQTVIGEQKRLLKNIRFSYIQSMEPVDVHNKCRFCRRLVCGS